MFPKTRKFSKERCKQTMKALQGRIHNTKMKDQSWSLIQPLCIYFEKEVCKSLRVCSQLSKVSSLKYGALTI